MSNEAPTLLSELAAAAPMPFAKALGNSDPALTLTTLRLLPAAAITAVLSNLWPSHAARALQKATAAERQSWLSTLSKEEVLPIVRTLPKREQNQMLDDIPAKLHRHLRFQLSFSPSMIGAWMDASVPVLPGDITLGEARSWLTQGDQDIESHVWVVNPGQKLAGLVRTRNLLRGADEELLAAYLQPVNATLRARADLRSAIAHPGWKLLSKLPITDHQGQLLGSLSQQQLQAGLHRDDLIMNPQTQAEDVPDILMHASWNLLADGMDTILTRPSPTGRPALLETRRER